jgi:hypothetical protein
MTTHVLSPAVAATVSIKSCHRCDGADFKRLAEYIAGGTPPTFSTGSVIPQHRLPLIQNSLNEWMARFLVQSGHGTARWMVSPLGRDADFFSR